MPCGCFGGKKKTKGEEEAAALKPPTLPIEEPPPYTETVAKPDDDANKTAKRRDVVASYCEDECALLGYRSTGSRPSSSCVDSPTCNSQTHTPSTVPVVASSSVSQTSSPGSSPSAPRSGACSRAELAEKRREFFRDFLPAEKKITPYSNLPTTLPTVARARQFGKVRPMRPVSQPTASIEHVSEPPPPGPHLLRPAASRSPTKIDANYSDEEGGFSSPEFLRELKSASEEISRRWAMSDDDDFLPYSPNIGTQQQQQPVPNDSGFEDDRNINTFNNNNNNNNININDRYHHESVVSCHSVSVNVISPSGNAVEASVLSSVVPETFIIPPSPPSAECLEQPFIPSAPEYPDYEPDEDVQYQHFSEDRYNSDEDPGNELRYNSEAGQGNQFQSETPLISSQDIHQRYSEDLLIEDSDNSSIELDDRYNAIASVRQTEKTHPFSEDVSTNASLHDPRLSDRVRDPHAEFDQKVYTELKTDERLFSENFSPSKEDFEEERFFVYDNPYQVNEHKEFFHLSAGNVRGNEEDDQVNQSKKENLVNDRLERSVSYHDDQPHIRGNSFPPSRDSLRDGKEERQWDQSSAARTTHLESSGIDANDPDFSLSRRDYISEDNMRR